MQKLNLGHFVNIFLISTQAKHEWRFILVMDHFGNGGNVRHDPHTVNVGVEVVKHYTRYVIPVITRRLQYSIKAILMKLRVWIEGS